METLTALNKLDLVLEVLAFQANMPERLVVVDTILEAIDNQIPRPEIVSILSKLIKDGNAIGDDSFRSIMQYRITFEGLVLHESGGYGTKTIIDDRNEKRIIRNEKWLLFGTCAAAIAAFVLLSWQVWIWFYPSHKDFVHLNGTQINLVKKK